MALEIGYMKDYFTSNYSVSSCVLRSHINFAFLLQNCCLQAQEGESALPISQPEKKERSTVSEAC